MNEEKEQEKVAKSQRGVLFQSAKESAFAAVFVALLLASQFVLSSIPGVEIVSLLFCAYAFSFGGKRGMLVATAFSLVRQLIFGFVPTVLILYLLYYNFLSFVFGALGKKMKANLKTLAVIVAVSCVCTAIFSTLDCAITSLWYSYSWKATRAYFLSSLPVMGVQTVCVGITVGTLFLPLAKLLKTLKKGNL